METVADSCLHVVRVYGKCVDCEDFRLPGTSGPYITVQGVRFCLSDTAGMQAAKDALCVAGELYAQIHMSDGTPTRRYLAASRYVEISDIPADEDDRRCASKMPRENRFKKP